MYHLDFETYSECDIKSLGHFAYAEHPSTRILLCAIAHDDGKVYLWDHSDPDPDVVEMIREMADSDELICAHNSAFEMAISNNLFAKTFLVPPPAPDRWVCTAAMCRRAAIPWSLYEASRFLQLPQAKMEGKGLIQMFCCPVEKYPKGFDKVQGWSDFRAYCVRDVEAERVVYKRLCKSFNVEKEPGFAFDARMNSQGIPVNREALQNALTIVELCETKVNAEFAEITGGLKPSQRDKVLDWLRTRGYPEPDLKAGTMEAVLEDPPETMDATALRALELRAGSAFAAVKKIPVMLAASEHGGSRVRGGFLWSGALRTHRWSGRIVQPQNFKRPTIKDTELAYSMIKRGCDAEDFDLMWDAGLVEVIASCVRHFIEVPGKLILDADYSNIEARITPWLCHQTDMLDEFRRGEDVYVKMAEVIFNTTKVSKDQRFVGKQATLACIAEGSLVVTDQGLFPIEKVPACCSVWDGVEWVRHEGVIYKGERETICYQGLQATPDHKVFVFVEGAGLLTVSIWGAFWLSLRLASEGENWNKIREVEAAKSADTQAPRNVCECGVPVWVSPVGGISLIDTRNQPRVPGLPCEKEDMQSTPLVVETHGRCQGSVSKPQQPSLEKLRGEGDRVSVQEHIGSGGVDCLESGFDALPGNRPKEQSRALREGELTVGNPLNECIKHPFFQMPSRVCLHCGGVAVRRVQNTAFSGSRDDTCADTFKGKEIYIREAEGLAAYAGMVRVYDIVNAGPRHRFYASGRLVHNCQFQVGWKKFQMMCEQYGRQLSDETCQLAVEKYREKRDKIVKMWTEINNAAKRAIRKTGTIQHAGRIQFVFGKLATADFHALQMKLPSGHKLTYPLAKVVTTTKRFGNNTVEVEEIQFWGPHPTRSVWGWQSTYGGKLLENATQAVGGDFMTHGLLEAEKRGYHCFATIHDQALCVKEKGLTAEGLREALCVLPAWAEDFPLDATANETAFYTKD